MRRSAGDDRRRRPRRWWPSRAMQTSRSSTPTPGSAVMASTISTGAPSAYARQERQPGQPPPWHEREPCAASQSSSPPLQARSRLGEFRQRSRIRSSGSSRAAHVSATYAAQPANDDRYQYQNSFCSMSSGSDVSASTTPPARALCSSAMPPRRRSAERDPFATSRAELHNPGQVRGRRRRHRRQRAAAPAPARHRRRVEALPIASGCADDRDLLVLAGS